MRYDAWNRLPIDSSDEARVRRRYGSAFQQGRRAGYAGEYVSPTQRAMPGPGHRFSRPEFRSGAGRRPEARPGNRYGGDYWWLGEHALGHGRYGGEFSDQDRFRRFSDRTRPHFSPIGGMYPPMGGSYLEDRVPGPLRETTRFSDWTRWF